ncbi:NAD(P)-dependent oxidoreductase [Corticibacterium sp. UT-5YL-CI-8]|nr:NAD(P)-dependent oxidoreductase [Tianweitania sp. UT-5YL-CI-8]
MPDQADRTEIAFIGVGSIGAPMAHRLLDQGRRLLICDPLAKARAPFAALGVEVAEDPAACSTQALVLFMVADDAQLRMAAEAYAGGLAAGPRIERHAAIMSTVLPETVVEVGQLLGRAGIRIVDAPVSGGSVKARDGTLSIMTGGERCDLDRFKSVFADLASVVFHCGPLGSGLTVKILNNLVGVTNLFLFSETMAVAKRLGLDPARLAQIMEVSSGRNVGTLVPGTGRRARPCLPGTAPRRRSPVR